MLHEVRELKRNVIPTGLINGSNADFSSPFPFDPDTLSVYINGMRLRLVEDYQTQGQTSIHFTASPEVGDLITIDFLPPHAPVDNALNNYKKRQSLKEDNKPIRFKPGSNKL